MTPSYTLTTALASVPVPVRVGVVSDVISSVVENPVSEAVARSPSDGATGAVVSTTSALLAPRDVTAPGVASVIVALLRAASRIVPPLRARAAMLA